MAEKEKLAQPPNKWYKSCVKVAKSQEKHPGVNPEDFCMIYWDELSRMEQASIWIEGLEICERPCESIEKKKK